MHSCGNKTLTIYIGTISLSSKHYEQWPDIPCISSWMFPFMCQLCARLSQLTMRRRSINTLIPRQNGRHFPDDIFKYIISHENVQISHKSSLQIVPEVRIDVISALVQIMVWRRRFILLKHLHDMCVIQLQ